MRQLVFLVEEASARELLKGLVPRLLDPLPELRFLVFEGKQDLEAQLVKKMRGWRTPGAAFVVLRDQDGADCRDVRDDLVALVKQSRRRVALVRVACRQLEAWIAGDLRAVAEAFERPSIAEHAMKAKFRMPDALANPVEDLRQLLPEYQKVDGARRVGPRLQIDRNSSPSFHAFCRGVRKLAGARV